MFWSRLLVAVVGLVLVPGTPSGGAAPCRADCAAVSVLHEWDRARASAFTTADVTALRVLYWHGSSAGRRDMDILLRYRSAGVRVTTMATQVFSVVVRRTSPHRIDLDVVDRVIATGDDGRRCLQLRASRPSRERVQLRRDAGPWQMTSVR